MIQRLTTAYLRSAITPGDDTWTTARHLFNSDAKTIGHIDQVIPQPRGPLT